MEKILRSKSWRPSQGPGASIHVSSYRIPESAESITILVLSVGQRIFINDMSLPWCKGESKQIKHATNMRNHTHHATSGFSCFTIYEPDEILKPKVIPRGP